MLGQKHGKLEDKNKDKWSGKWKRTYGKGVRGKDFCGRRLISKECLFLLLFFYRKHLKRNRENEHIDSEYLCQRLYFPLMTLVNPFSQ